MFRLWAKQWKDNHLLSDYTYERETDDTRTHMIMDGLLKACVEFDLENPIWLNHNIKEFQRSGKTRFSKDSFIEDIMFDYLEIEVLEEDF
ncbi:MAG: hypothetical protein K6A30_07120 [Lachnospiraceae bacterium]|nr:hypothetical protein [Lachnospiraceae bacterium]